MLAAVRLVQGGDQVEQPAALIWSCNEPPGFTSKPASHGDGLGPTVLSRFVSMVRHTVSISGASFLTSTRVRQSNDWIVVLCVIPALRTASTTSLVKSSGGTVSSGRIGSTLVSRL